MISTKRLFKYCCENPAKIENYNIAAEDTSAVWVVHHRLETHYKNGKKRKNQITKADLISLGLYWNRPASELIFLKNTEHNSLHMDKKRREEVGKMRGWINKKHHSEESKKKMSESHKGKSAWNKGVPMTEEQKKRLSEIMKGRPSPQKGKKLSEETRLKISISRKGVKRKPHSEETKRKIGAANRISLKGNVPWNKGLKGVQVAWNKGLKTTKKGASK